MDGVFAYGEAIGIGMDTEGDEPYVEGIGMDEETAATGIEGPAPLPSSVSSVTGASC